MTDRDGVFGQLAPTTWTVLCGRSPCTLVIRRMLLVAYEIWASIKPGRILKTMFADVAEPSPEV